MYSNQRTLAQEVKQAVMAELQQGNYGNIPQFGGRSNPPSPVTQKQQWGAPPPSISVAPPPAPPAATSAQSIPNNTYQMIKNSVKNEVLSEIQTQQADQMAQLYGLDRPLADQRIQQMIEERFQAIDNMKADLKKELLALQEMEAQRSRDPYIRQTAYALSEEARKQGISREQLLQSLDQNSRGSNIMNRLSEIINKGQRKGFLGGMALMLLCNFLFPSAHKKMHTVAVRSMEEGMAMVDRAKSFVLGQQDFPQQNPATEFVCPVPEPPSQQPPRQPPPPPQDQQNQQNQQNQQYHPTNQQYPQDQQYQPPPAGNPSPAGRGG